MRRICGIALLLLLSCPFLASAENTRQFEPSVGQQGKDVIWVPTPDHLVEAMLDAAKVTQEDFVIDLGSGDGRIVIAAARRGARAVGIEYNPDMTALSRRKAEEAGVADTASFQTADIFESDLNPATVITMYLLPQLNLRLRPTLLNLKPGTRIVSHSFTMDDWEADATIENQGRHAYLWIVPDKVEGIWTWQHGTGNARLALTQKFQSLEGTLTLGATELAVRNARMRGDQITFTAGDHAYTGKVKGKTIEGTVIINGSLQKWTAVFSAPRR